MEPNEKKPKPEDQKTQKPPNVEEQQSWQEEPEVDEQREQEEEEGDQAI